MAELKKYTLRTVELERIKKYNPRISNKIYDALDIEKVITTKLAKEELALQT